MDTPVVGPQEAGWLAKEKRSIAAVSLCWPLTLALTFAGLALGVPFALGASHLLGHLLFNVSANDPATLTAVALTLGFVAMLAGYVPARRAMRVDPMVALRHE